MDNYEIVLDKFHNLDYYDKTTIKEKLGKKSHIEVRKLLSKYNIVKPWDTNRACGKSDYFDIAELKTKNIIRPSSKLIVTRPTEYPEQSITLVYQNWEDKFSEIKEKILDKGYYEGFETDSKKIKCWFEDENILRFGTKKTDSVYIQFEKADLNSFIKQKHYFIDKETSQKQHLSYQAQISALGVYFGFYSKLARKERNQSIYEVELNTVATLSMRDLNINNLVEKKSMEQIDFIDVLWTEEDGKVIAAFEVELKRVWRDVLSRFQTLKLSCSNYGDDIFYIIVGDNPDKDYPIIREWIKTPNFYRDFQNCKIKYLPIQKLIYILAMRDKNRSSNLLYRDFFNNDTLLDLNAITIFN
jgi:hypothetical protein